MWNLNAPLNSRPRKHRWWMCVRVRDTKLRNKQVVLHVQSGYLHTKLRRHTYNTTSPRSVVRKLPMHSHFKEARSWRKLAMWEKQAFSFDSPLTLTSPKHASPASTHVMSVTLHVRWILTVAWSVLGSRRCDAYLARSLWHDLSTVCVCACARLCVRMCVCVREMAVCEACASFAWVCTCVCVCVPTSWYRQGHFCFVNCEN